MQVKIKKENKDGVTRLEARSQVKEILINEDFMHPKKESISVCFRGENTSGIIDFTPKEIEMIYDSIKNRIHLIKGFSRLTGEGARLI